MLKLGNTKVARLRGCLRDFSLSTLAADDILARDRGSDVSKSNNERTAADVRPVADGVGEGKDRVELVVDGKGEADLAVDVALLPVPLPLTLLPFVAALTNRLNPRPILPPRAFSVPPTAADTSCNRCSAGRCMASPCCPACPPGVLRTPGISLSPTPAAHA